MRDETRFAMVTPAPGFAARVMTRIVEHERARARRQALLGSALLVGAAGTMLGFAAIQFVSALWVLVTNPQVIVALLDVLELLVFWGSKKFNAFWIVVNVIADSLDPVPMMLLAVMVFALTMVWVRLVTGSFQLSPSVTSTNHVGGLRK